MNLDLTKEEAEALWHLLYGVASGDVDVNCSTPEGAEAERQMAGKVSHQIWRQLHPEDKE